MGNKTISRQTKCKKCGFQGVVEAHDTQTYPEKSIFKLLGKDDRGYIHLQCPSCEADNSYSPFEFVGSRIRLGFKLLIFVAVAIAVIWFVLR